MIEKIDRPDAPQIYTISRAKESKEDRHQQHNPKDDAERERRRRIEGKEWQKFGRRTMTIKPLSVPREKIKQCLFKSVNLHSGIGTLKVDVAWTDGKITRDVLMLVRRLEDFLKLRRLAQGEKVPDELWVRGPTVEMGIPQIVTEAGSLSGRDMESRGPMPSQAKGPSIKRGFLRRTGIVNEATGKINWGLTVMYAFVLVLALAAIIVAISNLG